MCSQHFEPTRDDLRSALAYGVGIWGLATTIIVVGGPILVPATGSTVGIGVTALYVLGALLVSYLAYSVYRLRRPDTLLLRLVFGTTAAASGLILDAVTYAVCAGRYPALSSFLLRIYVVVAVSNRGVELRGRGRNQRRPVPPGWG